MNPWDKRISDVLAERKENTLRFERLKELRNKWDFPVRKDWKMETKAEGNQICQRCHHEYTKEGPYEVQGEYVCSACYQDFLSWVEFQSSLENGK